MSWAAGVEEKRKNLEAAYPERVFGEVHVSYSVDYVYGEKLGSWTHKIVDVKPDGWLFWMEHQCDDFEIGGVEDAQQLISDLQAAIEYCSSLRRRRDEHGR